MRTGIFWILLASVLIGGCAGPYTMESVTVENGMVVGVEQVDVDGSGQITGVSQDGYVPDNRYLKSYEYGGEDLGPNAPGWVAGSPN